MKNLLAHLFGMLCLAAMCAALLFSAYAAAETGSCGADLTYTLDTETGLLTISGTGAMTDYYAQTPAPWTDDAASVRTVVLEEGVTTLGNLALGDCENLESLALPTTLTAIGTGNLPRKCPLRESMQDGELCIDGWLMGYKGRMPTDVCLGEGVVGVAMGVFTMSSVKTVVLPRSLRYVGRNAFSWCNSLTDVTILNPKCIIESHPAYLPFPQNAVLHGTAGSTAQTYAQNFGNSFAVLPNMTGDADGDGVIAVRDVLLTLQTLLNGGFDAIMDMNGDGELTLADVLLVLQAAR